MAFVIQCTDSVEAQRVHETINRYVYSSRFTATDIAVLGTCVEIRGIRLRVKKEYCGQHAGPCQVTPFERKHRKGNWLEGLDWVSWNEMLNDALDSIGHGGNVRSSVCVIRKQGLRRMDYFGGHNGDFHKEGGHYCDFRHREPPAFANYQPGTPGIEGYKTLIC